MLSTVVGETADSLVFFPIAFGGLIAVRELLLMMLIQILLKTLYEIIVLPLTIRVVNWIKKEEGSDIYDHNISYNPLRLLDL